MTTPTTSSSTGQYRWYVLFILTLAQSCHVMDRMVLSIVMEPVRHDFGLNDAQLGAVSSLGYGLAYGLAVLPMGMLVDRFPRTLVLATILGLWSALTLVCGLSFGFVSLLVARMAVGVAESGGSPAGMSLIADYFPAQERSTAVGLWYLSSAIGTVATFMVGGYVAATYGWRFTFFMAGLPGILLAVVVLLTIREPARGATDGPKPAAKPDHRPFTLRQSVAAVGSNPAVVHLLLGVVFTAAAISSYGTWSVSFLVRQHDLSLALAGVVVALTFGVVGAIGSALSGVVADRVNARARDGSPWRSGMIAALTSLMAAVLGILSLMVDGQVAALGLVAAYSLFFTAYNGPANGLLLIVAPPLVRGFTIAMLQLGATLVGYGIAPFLVGVASTALGGDQSLRYALALMLLCHVLAAVHFALAGRHVRAAVGARETFRPIPSVETV